MPKVISITDICGNLWLGMPSHDVSLSGGCKVLEKSTLKHCILQLNVKAIEECFFVHLQDTHGHDGLLPKDLLCAQGS